MRARATRVATRTINLCIGCVQGASRVVARPAQRRFERHYHPRFPHGRKHLVADIAMVCGILALIGANAWLLIARPSVFSDVELRWSAPEVVRVGETLTLTLTVVYDGEEALDRASIAFVFPEGLTGVKLSNGQLLPWMYNVRTRTLTLPWRITPGAEIPVTFSAIADFAPEDVYRMSATFSGASAGGVERQRAEVGIPVRGVAIDMTLDAPPLVPAHGVVGFVLRYRPAAGNELRNIIAHVAASNPFALVDEEQPWGEAQGISAYNSADIGELAFIVRTKEAGTYPVDVLVFQEQRDGSRVTLGTYAFPITVREVPVEFHIESDAEAGGVVRLGTTVEVRASSRIAEELAIPKASYPFHVRFEGDLMPATRIEVQGGAEFDEWGDRRPGYIVNSDGDGAGIAMAIPSLIRAIPFLIESDAAYVLTPVRTLHAGGGDDETFAEVEGAPFELRIAGDLRVRAFARYYTPEGDQLGRGPLPPRVGETTQYWVTWEVAPVVTDASHVAFRATLPEGVAWVGRTATTAGGRVVFDAATRTVSWDAGALVRTAGDARASFALALTPGVHAVGTTPELLGASTASFVDALDVPGEAHVLAVTIDLAGDVWAGDRAGSVRP